MTPKSVLLLQCFFGRLSFIYFFHLIHIYFTSPTVSIYSSGPYSVLVLPLTTQFHLWGIDKGLPFCLFIGGCVTASWRLTFTGLSVSFTACCAWNPAPPSSGQHYSFITFVALQRERHSRRRLLLVASVHWKWMAAGRSSHFWCERPIGLLFAGEACW